MLLGVLIVSLIWYGLCKLGRKCGEKKRKEKEAAEKLRVSLVTLDAWTKAGIINARRIGGRIYYTEKDINDALKKVSK